MKRIFILFIVTVAMCTGAQAQLVSSPTDYKSLTEEQFYAVFGSVAAHNFEETTKLRSSHHRLVMLIGARLWWLQEISRYMVENLECGKYVESDNDPIHWHFEVKKAIAIGSDNKPLIIEGDFSDSLQITKVKITGNTDLMVKLFLNYWESSTLKFDAAKFKKGCIFYQDFGSDRISFNWKGAAPYILISKSPNFPIALPLIAERTK